ncbi:MAG: Cupin 2, conserved barrel domain protein [Proteobacteria bacterium]|nr:Cupin 2, conserved barrel domain protein [Pseudomonadota bacterium]
MQSFIERMAEGNRAAPTTAAEGWTAHPSFPGVELKSLVRGAATGGAFSTLMVRIAPGGAMLPHRHDGQVEQHFVVSGQGVVDLAGRAVDYAEGALLIIPRATEHSIRAGETGMTLMALHAAAEAGRQDTADLRRALLRETNRLAPRAAPAHPAPRPLRAARRAAR